MVTDKSFYYESFYLNDPWLKKEDGKWLHSPQEQGVSNICVQQLMLPNRKVWDSNKIHSMFNSFVANSILTVPLFNDVEEDQLVWDEDMYGNYSVKSGYNLLLSETVESVAQHGNKDWKWLWKIHAPPKTKHLLWRICKGYLPTRTRLMERHVQCLLSCPFCEGEEENDWHVIYGCIYSKLAWQEAGVEHLIMPYTHYNISAKDCILSLCKNSDWNEVGLVATVIWCLWQNRNKWVWNNDRIHGQQVGINSMRLWQEWNSVRSINRSGGQQNQQQQLHWQAPPHGKYKCNVDAGVHAAARKTSSGWCIRDYRGRYVLGGSSWMHGRCSSNEGEALALLEAMKEVQQRGFMHVIFETDAYNVVNAIRRRSNGLSEFSSIIHKIKCMLSSNLGFEVKPIRRQANMLAHTIARAAISWSSRHIFDSVPACINNLLVNEII